MMVRSGARRWTVVICVLPFLLGTATAAVHAQSRKPAVKEVAAIRDCAKKHETDLDEVERQCLFNLVGTPCTEKPEGQSNVGMADCYRLEGAIWDDLLNENYKSLAADLDNEQKANCARCSVPGSRTVTARVTSTTRKSKARWLGRWGLPAPRARPPGAPSCSNFSAACSLSPG